MRPYLVVVLLAQLLALRLHAQDCCGTPACQAQARGYAQQLASRPSARARW